MRIFYPVTRRVVFFLVALIQIFSFCLIAGDRPRNSAATEAAKVLKPFLEIKNPVISRWTQKNAVKVKLAQVPLTGEKFQKFTRILTAPSAYEKGDKTYLYDTGEGFHIHDQGKPDGFRIFLSPNCLLIKMEKDGRTLFLNYSSERGRLALLTELREVFPNDKWIRHYLN